MRLIAVVVVAAALGVSSADTSPQQIVFTRVSPNPGGLGLFIASADGSDERPLLAARDLDYDPAFAPDGQTLVFTSERGGSADLFRVKADGTALERLTDDPAYDDQAAFSPDGRQLVFVSTRQGGLARLWTMDLATRRAKALTKASGGDFRPSWSPDGSWIAFASARDSEMPFAYGRWERLQPADLFIVRPDGSGLKRVGEHGNFCGSPKWKSDSRHLIAYCMSAEQTLSNRRAIPEAGPDGSDTRLVSFDVNTGASENVKTAGGVMFNPSLRRRRRSVTSGNTRRGLAQASTTWTAEADRRATFVRRRGRRTERASRSTGASRHQRRRGARRSAAILPTRSR